MPRITLLASAAIAWLILPLAARAEVFKLKGGGEVRGELANPDESPRQTYTIRPYAGGELKLNAEQVLLVVPQRPVEVEYEKLRLKHGDTVDEQWALAEWCKQNKLESQRKTHLERIIALDPDHADARRTLGYLKVGERWLTKEQKLQEEGKVLYRGGVKKYHGQWLLPQQIQKIEEQEKSDQVRQQWFTKLKQWRLWMNGDRAAAARKNILEITDKSADKALIAKLKEERDYSVKSLYVEALANLGTADAVKTIVQCSLDDPRDSFREKCLDLIEKNKPAGALPIYLKALDSKGHGNVDVVKINRAAGGLERLGDASAVPALIDHLLSTEKVVMGNPGQISPTFTRDSAGNTGTGLGLGGPKVVTQLVRNRAVLQALVKLTGQDFDYSVEAWKSWLNSTRKKHQPAANGRRD